MPGMAIELVNGYVCQNCTDVEHAQHGVDPADPKGTRKAEKAAEDGKMQKAGASGTASGTGSSSAAADPGAATSGTPPADGVNRPLAQGSRGTIVNLVT
jgi:hypothetical protein